MTKKQFESLAETLRDEKPTTFGARLSQWESVVRGIAIWCEKQNPQFDYLKFVRACGIDAQDHMK